MVIVKGQVLLLSKALFVAFIVASATSCGTVASQAADQSDRGGWSPRAIVPRDRFGLDDAELGGVDQEGIEVKLDEWQGVVGFVTITNHRETPIWYYGRNATGPLLFMFKADGARWRRFLDFGICESRCHWLRLDPGSSVSGTTIPFTAPGLARIGLYCDTCEWIAKDEWTSQRVGKSESRELWGPVVEVP